MSETHKSTKDARLRIFVSGSKSTKNPHWFGFNLRGIAGGFTTYKGIPMLVAEALKNKP